MNASLYDIIIPGTLYALLGLSIVTWVLIVLKSTQSLRASRRNRLFLAAFWQAPHLQAVFDLAEAQGPVARLAKAGLSTLKEVDHADADLLHTGDRQDLLERALRQQIHKERRVQEGGLAVLASIGSTAPFIGLFGTVWGIMHALVQIGSTGSASLEVVAGPIGEALVATGIGIAVAIPAVLAYNFFLRRLKLASADLDDFAADLISLARRSGYRLKATDAGHRRGVESSRPVDGALVQTSAPVLQGGYA